MGFHLSPGASFAAEAVCESLKSLGWPATVEQGVLRIAAIEPAPKNRLVALVKRCLPRRYPPYHEWRIYPDRFIRNVEVHWNVDALAQDDRLLVDVRGVMCDHGYPEVGRDPSEREVAERYGKIDPSLASQFDELERLNERSPAAVPELAKWWGDRKRVEAEVEQQMMERFSA